MSSNSRNHKLSSASGLQTSTSILHNAGPLYPVFDASWTGVVRVTGWQTLSKSCTTIGAQAKLDLSSHKFKFLFFWFWFGIAMGRRRVLVLAPAISRMQCMSNPYRRVKDGEENEKEPREGEVVRRASFWSSWRKRKAAKKRGGNRGAVGEPRRRWGFRVSKLRIRMLSPAFWLKKLRDSYVNMMLTVERNAPMDCSGMVTYPSYMAHPHYPGGGAGGGAWIWPAFPPPVVF